MRHAIATAGVLTMLLASQASAQRVRPAADSSVRPRIHRMEIYNGMRRTVAYFPSNLPEKDRVILRALGDAESDPPPPPLPPLEPVEVVRVIERVERVEKAPAVDPLELREHRYYMMMAWAHGSPRIRQAWGLEDVPMPGKKGPIKPAADDDEPTPQLILTLRDGQKVRCLRMEESGTSVVVRTTAGKQMTLAAREIVRIEEPAPRKR
jgi:hypothetical protein